MFKQRWLQTQVSLFLLIFTLTAARTAQAAPPAQAASLMIAGTVILTQGDVAVRRGGTEQWEPAQPAQKLHEGDAVRTGPGARCAILCVDESQIKVNEKTLLILKNVAPSPRLRAGEITPAAPKEPPASIYQVPNGEIWLRNKREKFNFELETPAVTATIRGTEINVQVKPDGATRVVLLEGAICLVNAYGEICLRPGEQGFVLPGQAPTKQMLVQPTDAVQWSLYYPGIFSFRDLPLTPQPGQTRVGAGSAATASLIQQGESAYDQGRLSEAQQAGESALTKEPDNARALTLLGWVALQKHDPDAALGYFRRVRQTDEMAVIGLALSRYRLGEIAQAYESMEAVHRLPPNPTLVAMTSFFAMLAGRVDQARTALETAVRQYPAAVLPRALLAQIYLAQNRKDAARQEADAVLSGNPNSPVALLTAGLVKLSFFEPLAAAPLMEKAIAADPRFVDAYVYLARIWLGSEYLKRARHVIDQTLRLAPKDGTVLSLAGFVRLAFRDYPGAQTYFDQAVKANPRLGEPHLGLAVVNFRHRQFDQGLEEMLTATLLEPRVSLYQSALGKALYQTRSFDRALEVWDYAKTLDPQDPTPHLYKGIALTDLNRPGEAIQEINESIAKNDNTATFRTRLSLDRDLAVRNTDLARAYDQLGLREWAFSKAVTAVKDDPYSGSAHLFLARSYQRGEVFGKGGLLPTQSVLARNNEELYYRLLAPANQNTWVNERNDNYTAMFEMPYARLLLQGGVGAWRERNAIWDNEVVFYGGIPGLGGFVQGNYFDDRGLRAQNSDRRLYNSLGWAKWDVSASTSLLGMFQYYDFEAGDSANFNDWGYANNPTLRFAQRLWASELGLVHRFSPKATLLTYFTYQKYDNRDSVHYGGDIPGFPGWTFTGMDSNKTDREFYNFQIQQNMVLGNHNLFAGVDYFNGYRYQQYFYSYVYFFGGMSFPDVNTIRFRPPERTYSLYLYDYWRLHPDVLLELGVIKDFAKNARDTFSGDSAASFYRSMWSPVFGINWQVNAKHTLRFALQRHLITHQGLGWQAATLLPTDTAGFPWLIAAYNNTEIRQIGVSWEAQWDPKTFTVLKLQALRASFPVFQADSPYLPSYSQWLAWKEYQASLVLNRILAPSWGLAAGVLGKRVLTDGNDLFLDGRAGSPPYDHFTELRGFFTLSFLHHTGWQGMVRTTLIQPFFKERADNAFGLVDLKFGKEFANKRGLATIEVTNLFDRRFAHPLEPFFEPEFYAGRRILGKLAFYF